MSTIFGKKISQLPPAGTALNSALVAIVQNGKTWYITFTNFLKNYYTKAEINALIDNIVGGGSATTTKVMEDQSIEANIAKTFTHDLNTEDFEWTFLAWSSTHSKYVQVQSPPPEVTRTGTTVSLASLLAYPKFKLLFKTYV